MKFTTVIAFAASAATMVATGGHAQNIRQLGTPAEIPPASFTQDQYIDSRGCIYIRAGIDGSVTWVPRVTRDRNVICGATPSLRQATAAAATPAPAPQPAPPAITPRPAPVTVAPAATAAPQVAPRVAATPRPTTRAPMQTIATTTRPPRPAPAPQQVRRAPAPAPAPAPVVVPRAAPAPTARIPARNGSPCPNASAFSQQFINDGTRLPVRCGPQQMRRQSSALQGDANLVRVGGKEVRVVPRHVYENRQNTRNVQVPEGYRQVWEDDRLNPHRAEQTLRGHADTQQIWTNTVPRRLVDPTKPLPPLSRPNVSPPAAVVLRPEASAVTVQRPTVRVASKQAAAPAPRTTISTRSQPAATRSQPAATRSQPAAAAGVARYVQIATFGVPANAQATAQRMMRSGLPVRMGRMTRGGRTFQTVMAGPFDTQQAAQIALRTVQGAGFGDAFIRR
ncbi:MAG: SPOR domain-containing protein [Rhodobacteraceae bacterium]|nr:SPOR domain-containing protein [Paracoccaceae bacterium]